MALLQLFCSRGWAGIRIPARVPTTTQSPEGLGELRRDTGPAVGGCQKRGLDGVGGEARTGEAWETRTKMTDLQLHERPAGGARPPHCSAAGLDTGRWRQSDRGPPPPPPPPALEGVRHCWGSGRRRRGEALWLGAEVGHGLC